MIPVTKERLLTMAMMTTEFWQAVACKLAAKFPDPHKALGEVVSDIMGEVKRRQNESTSMSYQQWMTNQCMQAEEYRKQ